MSMPASPPKDPRLAELGRRGARRRWGDTVPRTVRIHDLSEPQRRLVVALIQAEREKAAAVVDPATAESEGHGNDRPTTE